MLFETSVSSVYLRHARRRVCFNLLCFLALSCSAALLCLSVCFVWLFVWPFSSALPGFQQCTFLHTWAALLSLSYLQYGPLLFSYSWFHLFLPTFPMVSLALHLRCIFQGLCLYFRAGLISLSAQFWLSLRKSLQSVALTGFFPLPPAKLQKVSQVVLVDFLLILYGFSCPQIYIYTTTSKKLHLNSLFEPSANYLHLH